MSGIDGETVNEFAASLTSNLRSLCRAVRDRGGYRYQSLRPRFVPKPNGKLRIICIPTVRDRIVQRAILNYLTATIGHILVNEVSFGFIRGRTVADAAHRAKVLRAAHPWVLKTDISSFFDQIDRSTLEKKVRSRVRAKSLVPLLTDAIRCEAASTPEASQKKLASHGLKVGQGVRQGMPLSPFFSNLFLVDFDAAMHKSGLRMVRYADDLLFAADSESECHGIYERAASELSALGLTLPPIGPLEKSQIAEPSQAVEFLGIELTPVGNEYGLRLGRKQLDSIKAELFKLTDLGDLSRRRVTVSRFGAVLDGMIDGYLGAYTHCDNYDQLERALTAWRSQILERLLRDGLGISTATLSHQQKHFLELDH